MKKQLGSLIFFFTLWELISYGSPQSQRFFPRFSDVLWNLFLVKSEIFSELLFSLNRLLLGVTISIVFAVLMALAMKRNHFLEILFRPLIGATYPLPKIALFPFLMLLFGIGDFSKIALIALGSFYLMFNCFMIGLDRIYSSQFMGIVTSYNIKGFRFFYGIIVKGALLDFLTGLGLSFGYGLVMVVASEFVSARNGIGHYIWNAWDSYRILDMYSGLIVIAFIGALIHFAIDCLKKKIMKRVAL